MSKFETFRPTWAEINLDNLAFNLKSIKRFIGENISFMAVVKADSYGHGAIECCRRLEFEGIDWFGVALPEEGLELRNAGIKTPVLCLGGFWHGQEKAILENNLTPVVFQIEKAKSLNNVAAEMRSIANIHIKVDTGMGRLGVRYDELEDFADKLKLLKNINVEGIMTHFAAADSPSENPFTEMQIDRFNKALLIFQNKGFNPLYTDLANSPGAIVHKRSRANLVRIGGILYGLGDDVLPKESAKPKLKPVMSVYSEISYIKMVPKGETLGYSRTFTTQKDSVIATIPIGYHDGLPRLLSNNGRVIIRGCSAPIVGRVSMDWIIVDVSEIPNVTLEDKVFIIGEDNGVIITAEELAAEAGTISYEITCGINRRINKKYVGSK